MIKLQCLVSLRIILNEDIPYSSIKPSQCLLQKHNAKKKPSTCRLTCLSISNGYRTQKPISYYTFLYEKSARKRLENSSRYGINADDFNSTMESLFQLIAASETPILKLNFRGYLPCHVHNKNNNLRNGNIYHHKYHTNFDRILEPIG